MYHLRKWTQKDIAFILEVIDITFKQHIITTYWKYDRKKDESLWKQKIQDENHNIITYNDTDVWFLHVKEEKRNIHIDLLFIHPKYQNKGIWKSIIEDLIQKSIQEEKSLSVASLKSNTQAIHFYLKMGFFIINETEKRVHFMYHRQ